MSVNAKVLIPAKVAENSVTSQYTAVSVRAIIDKFTATNYSASTVTLTVHLISAASVVGDGNVIVKEKAIQPSETYTFPEIVGHILQAGDSISTSASAATSVNIRCSGREIS
jgi:hypothetical protein